MIFHCFLDAVILSGRDGVGIAGSTQAFGCIFLQLRVGTAVPPLCLALHELARQGHITGAGQLVPAPLLRQRSGRNAVPVALR